MGVWITFHDNFVFHYASALTKLANQSGDCALSYNFNRCGFRVSFKCRKAGFLGLGRRFSEFLFTQSCCGQFRGSLFSSQCLSLYLGSSCHGKYLWFDKALDYGVVNRW